MLSMSFETVLFDVIVVIPIAQPYKNMDLLISVSRGSTAAATGGSFSDIDAFQLTIEIGRCQSS